MGFISTDKNKITLIYNSNTSLGKQTYAYVSASEKDILTLDISKTDITGTQWVEIAEGLDLQVSDLINKEHPNFQKSYDENTQLEASDWLKVIKKHPETVAFPIVIKGDQFHKIENPSDFVSLIDADSAGVSRNPAKK